MTQLPHLQLFGGVSGVAYARPRSGFGPFETPPRDRIPHAQSLRSGVTEAIEAAEQECIQQGVAAEVKGIQLVLASHVGFDLKLESLENRPAGIQLLHAKTTDGVQRAVVFVPREAIGVLSERIQVYEHETRDNGRPKNAALIESIERIRLALARDLWTDATPFPTSDAPRWWEVWVPRDQEHAEEVHARFMAIAAPLQLAVSPRWLEFSERVVMLVKARASDWSRSRLLLETVAELRAPAELATPYLNLSPMEQAEWMTDLRGRLRVAHPNAPAVCLLDTGVHRGHPLLEDSLLEADWQSVVQEWGPSDNVGDDQHGTLMAGTALFGDLATHLSSAEHVELRHRIESVRILPRRGANDPDLYGAVTQQAVSIAEIRAPARPRVVCLAITATDPTGQGAPSSWSAAVDQLAYGDGERSRLVMVSAGNVREWGAEYQYVGSNQSPIGAIEDPSHASNALTVGAYTERAQLTPEYKGWSAVAPAGGLSPISRTSAAWDADELSPWPLKPDVVFEGGNLIADVSGAMSTCRETEILTTAVSPTGAVLDTNAGTSAAVAQGARLAAEIMAKYPSLRPETVRALIVHSAEWTEEMAAQVPANSSKEAIRKRIRTFGFGVPNRDRAIASMSNAVTLVAESAIQPYARRSGVARTNQMGLHQLPWPTAALYELGSTPVRMRVTLSYFIEPNPGRRGRIPRTRYGSHGLRFDVRRPGEDLEEFKRRLSTAERDDPDADIDATGESRDWVIGRNGRARGSLQGDWWIGTAEQLAASDAIAVFPVTGWWKERAFLQKVESIARYSLVVSIETPPGVIDLYAMIAAQTEVAVDIVGQE
ncbi:MAG: S8 family peptidase [Planctomycetota bacterium]|nr:MAG: S8 family peptidase [Planctomycetota bacterium]